MIYRLLVKPILFRFDPEAVHNVAVSFGEWMGKYRVTRFLLQLFYGYRRSDAAVVVDGISYRTPFLLSAGFDYNGRLTRTLPAIGLSGEEVGSVTARPCEGNEKPRLKRLPRSEAILVNKGLRNDGVDAIIARLQSRPRVKDFVIGISIARTNDAKAGRSIEDGIADYAYSFRKLTEAGVGDFYTINISCPNAWGGETFTTPELLGALLSELSSIPNEKPVYVKMPINLAWSEFEALLSVIDEQGCAGVVIGNLNKSYDSLTFRDEAPKGYCGGVSGKPCRELSTELIRKTRERFGKRFTIIGCGGVLSPEDALQKFEAGADLVQMITGLIFEGPGLPRACARTYAKAYKKRN